MREFELEPGEVVVRETRKHWFLFAMTLIPYLLLAVVPALAPKVLGIFAENNPLLASIPLESPYQGPVLGIWYLLVWTAAWGAFTRYYLNAWILTNHRLVEITQRGFFKREVSSTLLSRIQDVTSEVNGIIPSLLGLGSIRVQSAGAVEEFMMRGIPRPEQMRDLVLRYAGAHAGTPSV